MTIDPNNIPNELKVCRQWVLWRKVVGKGKVPYQGTFPHNNARTNDRETWCDFETAFEAHLKGGFDGIGFVFAENDLFLGLDLDNVMDETGQLNPSAAEIVHEFPGYVEISPSGNGLHLITKAKLPASCANQKMLPSGGKIEIYDRKRYFTFTGELYNGSRQPAAGQDRIDEIIKTFGMTADCPTNTPAASEVPFKVIDDPESFLAGNIRWGRRDTPRLDEMMRGDSPYLTPDGVTDFSATFVNIAREAVRVFGDDHAALNAVVEASPFYKENPEKAKKWDRIKLKEIPKTVKYCIDNQICLPPEMAFAETLSAKKLPMSNPAKGLGIELVCMWEMMDSPIIRPSWAIKNVLPKTGLVMVFGNYGTYKTFLVTDWLLSIAAGASWMGHGIENTGAGIYLLGEGHVGYTPRLQAWNKKRSQIGEKRKHPVAATKSPGQIGEYAYIERLKHSIGEYETAIKEPVKNVVIDTLNRNFGGKDENSTQDMTAAISNLDYAFGNERLVIIVHHTGRANTNRARGSIVLDASADAIFKLSVSPTNQARNLITLTQTKAKDSRIMPPVTMIPEEVEMRDEKTGEVATSCVLKSASLDEMENATSLIEKRKGLGSAQKRVLELIESSEGLEKEPLIEYLVGQMNQKKSNVTRPLNGLFEKSLLYLDAGGIVRVSE